MKSSSRTNAPNAETAPPLPLTQEHGSWAVLAIPIIVGFAVAGEVGMNGLFFTAAATAIFLSYVPLQVLLRQRDGRNVSPERLRQSRFWSPVLLIAATLFSVPLLFDGRWWLLAGGVLAVVAFLVNYVATRRLAKTLGGDLAATIGLVLGAPAAYYAVRGILDVRCIAVFLLCFLFFGSTVFYVHMKMAASAEKNKVLSLRRKLLLGAPNLVFQFIVIVALAIGIAERLLHPPSYLAIAPISAQAILGTFSLNGKSRYRNLGFVLLAQSILFALIAGFLLDT